ncbi:hypothetical protein RYH80_08120 [Halobaculum sp. MBLA0147]|uniref:DUF7472 family protein n=1 Tax=Halobaculum sp. MBLA0147 TaxID=3079934 RepID=UPI0035262E67
MDIDAGMRRKIAVSLGTSAAFVVLLIFVGLEYTTDPTPSEPGGVVLQEPGGTIFVGLFALFVLAMGAVGVYLDRFEE